MELTEAQLRDKLREACKIESQTVVGQRIGYSPQIINDILHCRRHISKAFARKFGYALETKRTVTRLYRPIL